MSRRDRIESILQDLQSDTSRYLIELRRLSIQFDNIQRLEDQEEAERVASAEPERVTDRDGSTICIGDTILFLTKGRFKSTEGIINRFSKGNERVFAIDSDGQEIPRAPRNVRLIGSPG